MYKNVLSEFNSVTHLHVGSLRICSEHKCDRKKSITSFLDIILF